MRHRVAGSLVVICIVMLCTFATAGQNQFGVANSYQVSFSEKVWVSGTLLPEGNYQVRHVMDGYKHVMVFRQVGVEKPVEVRAQCIIIALPEKATDNQNKYDINAASERVLRELVFKGDSAKHVF